jgi:hypothetical protein
MPRRRRLVVVLGVVAVLCGCGDLSHDELNRRIQVLRSVADEGELMAQDVARDRTKITFVRVRGSELTDDVEHEQEKMADATPAAGEVARLHRASAIAGDISTAIDSLRTAPRDREQARSTAATLRKASGELDDLLR